ncbi:MAG: HAD hydrolase family protein [Candidatus Auribacterota bacterium]|nr:HAD hydrolase family protein [Candidatus Auribacterota bacterium]
MLKKYVYIMMITIILAVPQTAWTAQREDMHIPAVYGSVIDSFAGLEDKSVLIILDAHCNYTAQKNIASLLDIYAQSFSPSLIALEGAQGELYVEDFQSFPFEAVLKSAAEFFLKEGFINGVEYFSLINSKPTAGARNTPLVAGVEDARLYAKNLSAYQSVAGISDQVRECLTGLLGYMENYADTNDFFAGSNLTDLQQSYRAGDISFFEYCSALAGQSESHISDITQLPNIYLFSESLQVKNRIQNAVLDNERKQLSKILAQWGAEWNISFDNKLQAGVISYDDYFRQMADSADMAGIPLEHYPQVSAYRSYLKLTDRINRRSLFTEAEKLADLLAEKIFDDPRTLTLYKWIRRLCRLNRMLDLDMSAEEYAMLNADRWNLDDLIAFARTLPPADSVEKLVSHRNSIESAIDGTVRFYAVATDRNESMIDNLIADMEMEDCQTAVMVVGGFHVDGICALLRDKGFSYRVISPAMSEHGHHALYRSRLSGEMSLFGQVIEKSVRSSVRMQGDDALAIASLLARDSLAGGNTAQAVRIEMKSIMTASAIRALEQTGIYEMEALRARVEAQLVKLWGAEHFPQLDSFKIYRALNGDLVVELLVNGVVYTFFQSAQPSTARRLDDEPGRLLGQFDMGGTTISILAGSALRPDASYSAGDVLIRQLAGGAVSQADIIRSIPDAQQLIDRWQAQGLITVEARGVERYLQLSDSVAQMVAPAQAILNELYVSSADLPDMPDSLKVTLERLAISEIVIDQATPLSMVVEFLYTLSQQDKYEFVHAPPHAAVLFEVSTETRVYFAQSVYSGLPGSGVRAELRILDHSNRPFDEQTRNDKVADIYNSPAVIDAVVAPLEARPQVFRSLDAGQPQSQTVVPLSPQVRTRDVILEKLYRFIGNPETFDKRNKALVFDLDGTLRIREDGYFLPIDQEITDLIRSFIEQGIYIVIVSGQPYSEIEEGFVSLFTAKERERMFVYPSNGAEAVSFNADGMPVEIYNQPLNLAMGTKPIDEFVQELRALADANGISGYQTRVTDSQIAFRLVESTNEQRHAIFHIFRNYIDQQGYKLKSEIAGRFSIDIAISDKAYAVRDFIHYRVPLDPEDILFFGDSYHGNDEPMAEAVPTGLHFHVGSILEGEQIPASVTPTDGNGPETTNAILAQLRELLDMVVRDRIDDRPAQKIARTLAAYYDFHRNYSQETPSGQMEEKLLWPIWFQTNETQWEQPVEQLEQGDFSKTFVGVGVGGVSLSYIAATQPQKAIIADINPWITQFFIPLRSAMIMFAPTRIEFISLLSGRPINTVVRDGKKYFQTYPQITGQPMREIPQDASLNEIYEFFSEIPFRENYSQNIIDTLIRLLPQDKQENAGIFWETYNKGMFQQFKFKHMLQGLIEADERAGRNTTWLSDEGRYQQVKSFIESGKLFAVEANWAGEQIPKLGTMLETHDDEVSVVYLSNVHHKVPFAQQKDGSVPWINFIANIASLPKAENALILSDQTLSNSPFESISRFNDSNYEKRYAEYVNRFFNPDTLYPREDAEFAALRDAQFDPIIERILNDAGKSDLAEFYRQADARVRTTIIEDYAQTIYKSWNDLRSRIRKSEPITGDEHIMSLELRAMLGYGLNDIDNVIGRFEKNSDFFMDLLSLPYSPDGLMGFARTVTNLRAQLVSTVNLYRNEPDVVLLDTALLTASSGAENFALPVVLDTFRDEHRQRHGRRVIFIAVDDRSSGVVQAKDSLDTSLFLRGGSAVLFDQVISAGFDPANPADRKLLESIKASIPANILAQSAASRLETKGISTPSREQMDAQIQEILQEKTRFEKVSGQITARFGITSGSISERVSVITGKNSFLHDFADSIAAGKRFVEPVKDAGVDVPVTEGVYLIDILRSIGADALPSNLEIVSVKNQVILNDEQKALGFEEYVELFSTIYTLYSSVADTNPTYGSFIQDIKNAVAQNRIPAYQIPLLFSPAQLISIFELQVNTPLNDRSIIAFFMQAVQEQFTTREKNALDSLLSRQIKLIRIVDVLRDSHSRNQTVTIADMMNSPSIAGMDLTDVASYLEVNIPPRPIDSNLGDAIKRQRLLDISA